RLRVPQNDPPAALPWRRPAQPPATKVQDIDIEGTRAPGLAKAAAGLSFQALNQTQQRRRRQRRRDQQGGIDKARLVAWTQRLGLKQARSAQRAQPGRRPLRHRPPESLRRCAPSARNIGAKTEQQAIRYTPSR